jgi:hypothetical protein
VGSSSRRLLAVLIAFAVAVLLRPSEAIAADAPTSVSCGEADDVALHNPPRPVLLPRHHGSDLDDQDRGLTSTGPGELIELMTLSGPQVRALSACPADRVARCSWVHWHPPSRGPPTA